MVDGTNGSQGLIFVCISAMDVFRFAFGGKGWSESKWFSVCVDGCGGAEERFLKLGFMGAGAFSRNGKEIPLERLVGQGLLLFGRSRLLWEVTFAVRFRGPGVALLEAGE